MSIEKIILLFLGMVAIVMSAQAVDIKKSEGFTVTTIALEQADVNPRELEKQLEKDEDASTKAPKSEDNITR
ncbi:MAG: hypothetical protein U9N11_01000 [Campylobacterota bacterium]|nr:hypothetical protein [Campylobacterota bacterium]